MTSSSGIPWRRIGWIQFWLCLFPPWGLWLLYKEPELTTTGKWRVLLYSLAIPVVLVLVLMALTIHSAQHAIEGLG